MLKSQKSLVDYGQDLWSIVKEGVSPDTEKSLHTVFAIGNGRIGIRGTIPELPSGESQGIFMAGFYDRMTRAPIDISGWNSTDHYFSDPEKAVKERVERYLVKCPDFLDMKWEIDGERVDCGAGKLASFKRSLDMSRGMFICEAHWISPGGKEIKLTQKRFADMARTNRVFVEYALAAVNFSGRVVVKAGINTNTSNIGDTYITNITGKPDVERLYNVVAKEGFSQNSVGVLVEGKVDRQKAAFATALICEGLTCDQYTTKLDDETACVRVEGNLAKNTVLSIKRVSALASSRIEAEPMLAVKEAVACFDAGLLNDAKGEGIKLWEKYWADSDILIEGDPWNQVVLRHSIYNLIIAASQDDSGVSIPAKALTSEYYQGNVFWDTDIHMLPFYIFTQPHLAKNLVTYRHHLLDGARSKALSNGFQGAQYPWCSAISGAEECPLWLKWVTHQLHIIGDIAYAAQNYVDCTGDDEFYRKCAAEVFIETARFWISKAEEDGGTLTIRNAAGPDEGHVVCDNSAYVNNLAIYNLSLAQKAIEYLKENYTREWDELAQRIGISPEEEEAIINYQGRIKVMRNSEGLYEQFEGYFKLRDEMMSMDAPDSDSFLTQTVKQADVLMLLYLLPQLQEEGVLKANWDYYEPRTLHSSSLSFGVHCILAAQLGLNEKAKYYMEKSLELDLNDSNGNAAKGAHMAAHGMNWSLVVNGLAGCLPGKEKFMIDPRLPEEWKRVRFNLKWKGAVFTVDINGKRISVTNRTSASACLPLSIQGKEYVAHPGETIGNHTYYVDAITGSDSNSGTGAGLAWKTLHKVNATTFGPGDQILFKAGCSWTGQLYPKGSGSKGMPIAIGMYGSGNKPAIDGSGNDSAVKLFNQQYWEINDMDVSNGGSTVAQRTGIYVTNDTTGQLNHIKISHCNVHDIQGVANGWYGYNAGIVVAHKALYPSNTCVKWDDIVIDNNTITNVDRAGVYVGSVTHHDDTGAGGMWPMFDHCARNTRVTIRNNAIENCGGDGIVIWLDSYVSINHNTVSNSGVRSVTAPADPFPYGCTASAAMWGAAIDHVIYEYNEIDHFGCGGGLGKDGTAFDLDTANTYITIQYNYSHDNTGGFLESCDYEKSGNCVIRYNIINNDSYGVYICNGGSAPRYGGAPLQFYNNTVYLGNEVDHSGLIAWNTRGAPQFSNNIFYFLGNNGHNAIHDAVFNNNIFYGNHPGNEPSDPHKIISDPLFVNPQPAKVGMIACDGFELASGSAALGGGMVIADNGGKDFYGNPVSSSSAPNIGAFNGSDPIKSGAKQ